MSCPVCNRSIQDDGHDKDQHRELTDKNLRIPDHAKARSRDEDRKHKHRPPRNPQR